MKVFNILNFFIITNICTLVASSSDYININWFSFGVSYIDKPAIGWYIFTFIVFVMMIVYFSHEMVYEVLKKRSNYIKHEITKTQQLKVLADKKILEYNNRVNTLENSLKKIFLDFKEKYQKEQIVIKNETSNIIKEINNNIENIIKVKIHKVKVKIKNDFIRGLIKEIILISKSKKKLINNKEYHKILKKNISNLKLNI